MKIVLLTTAPARFNEETRLANYIAACVTESDLHLKLIRLDGPKVFTKP